MGRGRRGSHPRSLAVEDHGIDNPAFKQPDMEEKTETSSLTPNSTMSPQRRKKQKRDEYRASIQYEADPAGIEITDMQLPKKKWFRQRAHANPFSDHRLAYPLGPTQMDWSSHYPAFRKEDSAADNSTRTISGETYKDPKAAPELTKNVEIADIGCGFGGLLFAMAPQKPTTLMLGMEIRTSVTEFVENKVRVLRQQQLSNSNASQQVDASKEKDGTSSEPPVPGGYQNISVVRTNSMKFLPNFFPRGSLKTIFLCFPDPHFKNRKHKARIVSSTLNSEYAYVLKEGGFVATITDVEELGQWMAERFDSHESFERVAVDEFKMEEDSATEEEREARWLVKMMKESTEEGKKVDRFGGNKFVGVWKRLKDPAWPEE